MPYADIKKAVIGSQYQLSLNFIGDTRARKLNKATRHKSYIPNVLSFPLSETCGEIYIAPSVAKRECKQHEFSYRSYIGYLFIHGLLHLRGHKHGPKMEKLEQKFLQQFNLTK